MGENEECVGCGATDVVLGECAWCSALLCPDCETDETDAYPEDKDAIHGNMLCPGCC